MKVWYSSKHFSSIMDYWAVIIYTRPNLKYNPNPLIKGVALESSHESSVYVPSPLLSSSSLLSVCAVSSSPYLTLNRSPINIFVENKKKMIFYCLFRYYCITSMLFFLPFIYKQKRFNLWNRTNRRFCPVFPVYIRFSGLYPSFDTWRFLGRTEPDTDQVHGWTGRSDPVFITLVKIYSKIKK